MKLHRTLIGALFFSGSVLSSLGAVPDRIHGSLEKGDTFVLQGNVHPLIAAAVDNGSVAGSLELPDLSIHFKMTDSQQADLAKLLEQQQDPSSPQYHKWLTPEQYAERFGLSESDIKKVTEWLGSVGFSNIKVARGCDFVTMSGTAAEAQYAFQTAIHQYTVRGESHYANAADPVLPKALAGIVASVRGLNDIHPLPHTRKPGPRYTSSLSGNVYMAPGDFATIYDVQALYNAGVDGTGETIAVAGQSQIQTSIVEAFQTAAGLTVKAPQLVLAGSDPGLQLASGDEGESELDVEWSGAVARGATILFAYSTDVFASARYVIDNNLAPVLSLTYGACEAQNSSAFIATMEAEFQKANTEGITVTGASGDTGAADCDSPTNVNSIVTIATQGLSVDYPASSAYVTGVGGTEFSEGVGSYWGTTNSSTGGSALSYIPEMAWDDTNASNGLSATGGGASILFTKPSWQTGTGVPSDGQRDVPDMAVDASPVHDPYLYCTAEPAGTLPDCTSGFRNADTYFDTIGGTSVASPTFAGIVALIDQFTNTRQGNINLRLYSLAAVSTDAFHDVTVGNNEVPCQIEASDTGCTSALSGATTSTMGYVAGPGYDQTTGLGSPDAYNMVQQWAPSFTISASPSALTLSAGASGSSIITVVPSGAFSANVTFTCSVASALTNTTCSVPGTVSGSSGSVTLMVVNNASTSGSGGLYSPLQNFPHRGGRTWLLAGGVLTMFIFLSLTPGRKRAVRAGLGVASLAVMASCGGGSSSSVLTTPTPTTVTGLVTVTATSAATSLTGALTRTATVSVTVSQ